MAFLEWDNTLSVGIPSIDTQHQKLQSQFKSGELLISVKVLDFLKRWVSDHMQKSDKQYQDFFLAKGIS